MNTKNIIEKNIIENDFPGLESYSKALKTLNYQIETKT